MSTYQLILYILAAVAAFVILRPLLFGGSRIHPAVAAKQIEAGTAVLIDVRDPYECRSGVAKPAALLPLSDLHSDRRLWGRFLQDNKEKLLIVYCASGIRSGTAAAQLKKEGFRVANLGGYNRWARAGLPVRIP